VAPFPEGHRLLRPRSSSKAKVEVAQLPPAPERQQRPVNAEWARAVRLDLWFRYQTLRCDLVRSAVFTYHYRRRVRKCAPARQ
jgi:hypothetical protein